jgi:hypothetical protein
VGRGRGSLPSQASKLARGAAVRSQSRYRRWDLLERKERLQLEQCSGARKPVARCSGEGWGFYGRSSSALGGFFSLAMGSRAFSGELVCLPLNLGRWGTILRAFCLSALWQIYQTQYFLFRVQKCRFTTPQDAGIPVLSMGDGLLTHLP